MDEEYKAKQFILKKLKWSLEDKKESGVKFSTPMTLGVERSNSFFGKSMLESFKLVLLDP